MKWEDRLIKASALTGFTDILLGLLMYWTGWGDWYYSHFHIFGIFGFSMIVYAYWHLYLIRQGERK
jgi:hypothetical protein